MLLAVLFLCACDRPANPQPAIRNPQLVIPEHGLYAGAYIDFGEREDGVTLEKIANFDRLVRKEQALVASSSYWGEQTFPKENMELIARYGAVPLVFWSPWEQPYKEGLGPDKYSLTSIIAGEHDAYIDRWADGARGYDRPMIVSFANRLLPMNSIPKTPSHAPAPVTSAWAPIAISSRIRPTSIVRKP